MVRKTAWALKFDDFILLSSLTYYLNIIALLAVCDKIVVWAFFRRPLYGAVCRKPGSRKNKACVQCPRVMAGTDQAKSGQLG